ncbi:hypothetical protein PR048_032469 [Dryococelus australis]|uniref:FLYWCH-type domain-containing protein n=1 Tax=Dryococelus australis TaxID=614101 RepID=A0ABQ9G6D6_9NEOP|nr:hypothetical protein PR048_032469 [Dryococelus australis]
MKLLHCYGTATSQDTVHFICSQRGFPQLVLNNYIYKKEKTINNKVHWKCTNYDDLKCRGRVATIGKQLVATSTFHNHEPPTHKILYQNTMWHHLLVDMCGCAVEWLVEL